MKYNFENEYLTASTDSTAVAKRLIEIIEEMEKKEDPVLKTYLGDKEFKLPEQPFKGAIVVDEPEKPIFNPQTKREFAEIMAKRTKKDTPSMNITSRLPEEPADIEDEFVNHCVKRQAAKIKPAKGEKWPHEKFTSDEYPPENIENEDIEIDDEPEQRVPEQIDDSTTGDIVSTDTVPDTTGKYPSENSHPKKVKSSEIVPQEGTVEEAYMGEHFEVAPDDPEEKPLTPAEQELWDYIQKNPQYTMTSACRDLKITTANYYWRKRQLFLKGRKVGGTIAFAKKAED